MKIYSIKYTDNADLPKARPPITVTHQKMRSVKVSLVTEGSLTRIVLKQTGGTAKICKIRVLDSGIPYPEGEYNAGTSADDDVELYEIISQQTLTPAGSALAVINQEYGYPFHNQDGTYTDNQRYIYIILEPQASADDTTWDLAITCRTEVD